MDLHYPASRSFRGAYNVVLFDAFTGIVESALVPDGAITVGELAAAEGHMAGMRADDALGAAVVMPDGTLAVPWDALPNRSPLERAVEAAELAAWTDANAWFASAGFGLVDEGPEVIDGQEVWRLAPVILLAE